MFELDLDFDALGGSGKKAKVRELILYLDRRGQLPALIDLIQEYRPKISLDPESDRAREARQYLDKIEVK